MLNHFGHVRLLATPRTVAHQAPCPWDFPGKNTGVDCHALLQGIFPTRGSNPHLPASPALQADSFFTHWAIWEAWIQHMCKEKVVLHWKTALSRPSTHNYGLSDSDSMGVILELFKLPITAKLFLPTQRQILPCQVQLTFLSHVEKASAASICMLISIFLIYTCLLWILLWKFVTSAYFPHLTLKKIFNTCLFYICMKVMMSSFLKTIL